MNATGAMSTTGGTALTGALVPLCLAGMLGKYNYARTSMFIIGNSRDAGPCGMQVACTAMKIPVVNFGYNGSTIAQWAAWPTSSFTTAQYCTDAMIGDCINDLSAGASLATVQTAFNAIVTKLKAVNPTIRIWGKKTLPNTDTSDAYATVANQTGRTGAVYPGSVRDLYNAWLDTLVGVSIYGLMDPCVALEYGGSGASGKWVPLSTTDGLHEIGINYINEGVLFRQQFLAQGGISNNGAY